LNYGAIFELDEKEKRIKKISNMMSDNSFWKDQSEANQKSKELKELQIIVENINTTIKKIEEIEILYELNLQENSVEIWAELFQKTEELEKEIAKEERNVFFIDEYDKNNAIVSIHPGAGGTESQDWAEMLLRMYLRWCEKNSFKAEAVEPYFPVGVNGEYCPPVIP